MEIEDRKTAGPIETEEEKVRKQIELRAYQLFLERGMVDGFDNQDRLQAEDEVLATLLEQPVQMKGDSIPKLKKAAKSA
jgi:hypothetical protein